MFKLKERKITPLQPLGTLIYEVSSSDTLERIALKFNTVPSEIIHLNRLSSRMIYPSQTLFVPDPDYIPPTTPPPTSPPPRTPTALSSSPSKHFKWKSNETPKPGHIEVLHRSHTISSEEPLKHVPSSQQHQHLRHTLSEDEAKKLDEECMQRFLKINSRIISYNKGISVDGVLLVTPSAVMFDPIVNNSEFNSDAPAKEEAYESIIIPIEIISNVILYEDLSLKDIHDYFLLK